MYWLENSLVLDNYWTLLVIITFQSRTARSHCQENYPNISRNAAVSHNLAVALCIVRKLRQGLWEHAKLYIESKNHVMQPRAEFSALPTASPIRTGRFEHSRSSPLTVGGARWLPYYWDPNGVLLQSIRLPRPPVSSYGMPVPARASFRSSFC